MCFMHLTILITVNSLGKLGEVGFPVSLEKNDTVEDESRWNKQQQLPVLRAS